MNSETVARAKRLVKDYRRRGLVKDGAKTLGYQFMISIKLRSRLYTLEIARMKAQLKEMCRKEGMDFTKLVIYADLVEDRRNTKTIPKGYRVWRFLFCDQKDLIFVPGIGEL